MNEIYSDLYPYDIPQTDMISSIVVYDQFVAIEYVEGADRERIEIHIDRPGVSSELKVFI